MAGGYPVQNPDPLGPLLDLIHGLQVRLDSLEKPTGTSLSSLYAQVQAALIGIDAKVQASIAANSYTKAQIDSKIAAPGNISPANVSAGGSISAGGTVSASGVIISPGSHNFNVTSGYVAAWINGDGTFGTSASSREVKRDLVPLPDDAISRMMNLPTYHGHYLWDRADSQPRAFLLAEDVRDAQLSDDLVVEVETDDGPLLVLNHALLVVPLLAAVQQLSDRVSALEQKGS